MQKNIREDKTVNIMCIADGLQLTVLLIIDVQNHIQLPFTQQTHSAVISSISLLP